MGDDVSFPAHQSTAAFDLSSFVLPWDPSSQSLISWLAFTMQLLSKIFLATSLATFVNAHPGEHHEHNAAAELTKREIKYHARR